jgi:hypothetical protein
MVGLSLGAFLGLALGITLRLSFEEAEVERIKAEQQEAATSQSALGKLVEAEVGKRLASLSDATPTKLAAVAPGEGEELTGEVEPAAGDEPAEKPRKVINAAVPQQEPRRLIHTESASCKRQKREVEQRKAAGYYKDNSEAYEADQIALTRACAQ